jgi:hypothetical protein
VVLTVSTTTPLRRLLNHKVTGMLDIDQARQEAQHDLIASAYGISVTDLCCWDAESKTLLGSQKAKAREFNRLELIKYAGNGKFHCLPVKGYNKTTYTLEKRNGEWTCSCQWYCKQGLVCSHIQALWLYLKNKSEAT